MKKFIFIFSFIYLFLFVNHSVFPQNFCNDTISCPADVKYPYYSCYYWDLPFPTHSAGPLLYCSSDPSAIPEPVEWDGHKGGVKPRKIKLPICIELDEISVPTISFFGEFTNLLSPYETQVDANNSTYKWNCLCGFQDSVCQCQISLCFTKDRKYFIDPKKPDGIIPVMNTLAVALTRTYSSCTVDCGASSIFFNNTDEFIDDMPGLPNKFFVNTSKNTEALQNLCKEIGINSYSFEDIALHELGHILGFGHFDKNPLDTYINKDECSIGLTGVMYSFLTPNKNNKGLSIYDKCMFKKLYCPNTTSINDDSGILISIIPTPSKDFLTVSSEISIPIEYQIYNELGQLVLDGYLNSTNKINISNLTSGIYFLRMNNNPNFIKFIKE